MSRFYVALLAVSACLAADKAGTGVDAERLARITPRMKEYVDKGQVAGTVTLVSRKGAVLHHEATGFLDIETKKPMAKDSIFQIMSMTKPMVAVAIMILAEEGRLALVDPVEKHLPEFRGQMVIAAKGADGSLTLKKPTRPITVRDLLTHTSGLSSMPPAGIKELYQTLDRSLADATLLYSQMPLEFEPGSKWLYSNPGIATLGRIVEVAAGQPFESFMSERVWKPLGMKDTFIFPPEDKKARIAMVHAMKDGKLDRADGSILGGEPWGYRKGAKYSAPEFGAYSTAADLAAFYEMTRNGGMAGGKRILSPASIEVMTSLHTGNLPSGHMPGTGFGLAWEVVKDSMGSLNLLSVGTFGHGGAFGTHGWVDKKRDLVGVFLVQGGAATDVKYSFMRMVNAALTD